MRRILIPGLLLALSCPGAEVAAPVEVTGTYACEALGRLPADVVVEAWRMPERKRIRQSSWSGGRFSLLLPPGEYLLSYHGVEVKQARSWLVVPEGEARIEADPMALEPSPLAERYGKPLPDWTLGAARGISPEARPADFKGRWLLLAFWGFW